MKPKTRPPTRLWRLMQLIERCRHRAALAEQKAEHGSATFRAEMADLALQWRDLARQHQWLAELAERPYLRMARR